MSDEIKKPPLKLSADFRLKFELMRKVVLVLTREIHCLDDATLALTFYADVLSSIVAAISTDEKDYYAGIEFIIKDLKDPKVVARIKPAFGSMKVIYKEYLSRN